MVRVSGLKRVLSEAYIGLGRACCSPLLLWLGRSRLILSNNRPEGNELVAAVASFRWYGVQAFRRVNLLWTSIFCFRFRMQLKLILTVFR